MEKNHTIFPIYCKKVIHIDLRKWVTYIIKPWSREISVPRLYLLKAKVTY